MKQDNNIPQGYKQTELGIIPKDWEVKTIASLGNIVGGGTPSTIIPAYWDGGIQWFTPAEIGASKYISKSERTISKLGLQSSAARILPKDAILLTTRASIGLSAILSNEATTNQGFQSIIVNTNNCNEYAYYALKTKVSEMFTLASGSTFAEISKAKLASIKLPIPPIAEQRAIAEALSDVDGLIAALDKKIAKKRLLKQGTMQQLLTGKKRLPGFTDKWVEITFGDYVDIYRGGSPRPIENYITDNPNGVNWIKIGDVKPNDKYINKTEERIIPDGVSRSRRVDVGDFILSNSMSFGRPYILGIDGCIHDGWLVIQNYHNNFDKDYLYYLLCSEDVMMQYMGMAAGSSVKNLNKEKVASLQLCMPTTIKEQQAIAIILSDMDKEIADLEAQRDKYRLLKSGMMQKLLTGQIRLKTEKI